MSTGFGDLYVGGSGEFSMGLRVGDAQNGIELFVGTAPSATSGFYKGTSRPVKTISRMPQYSGMTTSQNPKGVLTTGFDSTTGAFRNYYNWTTTDTNAQSLDMFVQIAVPRDFSSFTAGDQICFNVFTDDTSGASKITSTFYDTANTALPNANITPTTANAWQRMCTTNIGGTVTVNGTTYVTVQVSFTAAPNKNVRLGDFSFDYLGAF
jgi:hypothetical protein